MTGRSLIQAAGFAAFAVALDQATKAIMLAVMQPPRVIPVTPFFNLALGFNEGASFGMVGGMMQGRPFAMIALTCFITVLIGVWALRANTGSERAGLSLIFGGSLGNIIDRFRQGAVTDFLDFYWQDWHWPTFNMADVAIFIGAMLILLNAMPLRRKTEATRA
jgi:signal peptidase II